ASTSTTSTPLNATVRTRATMPGPGSPGPSPARAEAYGVCRAMPAARASPPGSALRRLVGPGQQVAAAGLVRPVFPGAPGLDRIRAVAANARRDLAVRQVFDLAAELLRAHQRAGVARQVDRQPHDLDQ